MCLGDFWVDGKGGRTWVKGFPVGLLTHNDFLTTLLQETSCRLLSQLREELQPELKR